MRVHKACYRDEFFTGRLISGRLFVVETYFSVFFFRVALCVDRRFPSMCFLGDFYWMAYFLDPFMYC